MATIYYWNSTFREVPKGSSTNTLDRIHTFNRRDIYTLKLLCASPSRTDWGAGKSPFMARVDECGNLGGIFMIPMRASIALCTAMH